MAGGAARFGTVSVLPRRVPIGRAVRRLLVLAGLLIAGWLLGGAAQSAHADELPRPAAHLVAKAPVLERAAAVVHGHEPLKRTVTPVVANMPRAAAPEPPAAVPPAPIRPDVRRPVAERSSAAVVRVVTRPRSDVRVPPKGQRVPVVSKAAHTRSVEGHAPRHADRHPAPPAPERHGDHSAAAGLGSGMTAGFPAAVSLIPPSPRASVARVSGALPPAVRTAADEPSFAPD
ncbi:hypothetical protein AB0C74_04685 [Spirillospora sp. NPDC048832]